jgi:hypothetical protein
LVIYEVVLLVLQVISFDAQHGRKAHSSSLASLPIAQLL